MKVKFKSDDNNWQEESTTYWFELTGKDYGTQKVFDFDVYGVVESGNNETKILNEDGYPMSEGDIETIAVRNSIFITDEIRKEASGL